MTLLHLAREFAALPHADIAADAFDGPPRWAADVGALADAIPTLRRYPDYLEFLARFNGAGVYNDGPERADFAMFRIFGLDELPAAPDDGFYSFAELHARYAPYGPGEAAYDGCVWQPFSLDTSGARPAAVFGWGLAPDSARPRWDTFTAFLQDVVTRAGHLPLEARPNASPPPS